MVKKPPTDAPMQAADFLVQFPAEEAPHYIMSKFEARDVRLPAAAKDKDAKDLDFRKDTDPALVPPMTFYEQFKKVVDAEGDKIVFGVEWPEPPLEKKEDGSVSAPPSLPLKDWKTWTYNQVHDESQLVSIGLLSLGLEDLDGVSILGANSPFWALGGFGTIMAGGTISGIYPTDTQEQVAYKAQVSDTCIVLVDTISSFEKYAKIIDDVPYLKAIIIWKDTNIVTDNEGKLERKDGSVVKLLSWEDLMNLGRDKKEELTAKMEERIAGLTPGRCCSLCFTSGTTGKPKAVMISHDNLIFQCKGNIPKMPPEVLSGKQDLITLSFLPLSHIAGFYLDVMVPVLAPEPYLKGNLTVYFARSYDLKAATIVERLKTVRPTMFVAVPRLYEKFAEKIKANAPKGAIAKSVGSYAKGKMLKSSRNLQMGGSGKNPFFGMSVSKKLLGKVKQKLGLDRTLLCASAAAPMKMDMLQYWGSLGFYVSEAYGLSENTGVATATTNNHRMWGTVGYPQPGTEIKVFKVDDNDINKKEECKRAPGIDADETFQGEICIRGRHVMLGYLANPKLGKDHEDAIAASNAKAIDNEGWLHTGDKGLVTETGMLKITGRYKELIIGAGGENIAPVPIEDDFKARCSAISNIMMVGNERKYNTALVTLVCKGATGEKPGTENLDVATTDHTTGKTITEATKDAKFIEKLEGLLKETNANGKVIHNNAFKIQKFTILPHDFSVETGELTPSLKLKRSVVEKKYAKEIDAMYEDDGSIFVQTLEA